MSIALISNRHSFHHITQKEIMKMMKEQFPEIFEDNSKTFIEKTSYNLGKFVGNSKNFFSKTETKAATLLAYWAADAFVALALIMTAAGPVAVFVSLFLLIIHTYATFSVVGEITNKK